MRGVGGKAQKTQTLSPGSWSLGSRMQVLHKELSVMGGAASFATEELCDCSSLRLVEPEVEEVSGGASWPPWDRSLDSPRTGWAGVGIQLSVSFVGPGDKLVHP